jgi:hypothetical protein
MLHCDLCANTNNTRYRYLGKVIALATHSSTTAKFDAVIARLTAIMPLGRGPSFSSIPGHLTGHLPGGYKGGSDSATPAVPEEQPGAESAAAATGRVSADGGQGSQRASTRSLGSTGGGGSDSVSGLGQAHSAGFGAIAAMLKGGGSSTRSSGDGPAFQLGDSYVHGAEAAAAAAAGPGALAVQVRAGEQQEKVTCISYTQQPLAAAGGALAPCVWWAVGERLEFYSEATQSTTSFAPRGEGVPITAVSLDAGGNVWAATSRGCVMVRRQRNWEQVSSRRAGRA